MTRAEIALAGARYSRNGVGRGAAGIGLSTGFPKAVSVKQTLLHRRTGGASAAFLLSHWQPARSGVMDARSSDAGPGAAWRAKNAKALAGSARALAKLGDGMLRVQSPEGRNALHHRVPLPWLWESCKTSAWEADCRLAMMAGSN